MRNFKLFILILIGALLGFGVNCFSYKAGYNKGWNKCMDDIITIVDAQIESDTTTTTFIQFDDTLYYQFSHKKLFE